MSTATTTGTTANPGLGERIATALFAEVDRRRQEQGPTALGRDVLRPAFVAIIERECRDYVTGKPAKATDDAEATTCTFGDRKSIPPLPEWVTAYSAHIGYPMKGELWCDAYAQKGWQVGKKRMVDWQAAVRNWKASGYAPASFMANGGSGKAVVGVEAVRDYTRI